VYMGGFGGAAETAPARAAVARTNWVSWTIVKDLRAVNEESQGCGGEL
jgi:hypothetical protein